MGEDREVNEILSRIARRLVARPRTVCCSRYVSPAYEVVDPSEIEDLRRRCKALFVYFYTTNCPYCHLYTPIYKDVASRHSSSIGFIKFNLDRDPRVAWRYNVLSTPTTLVFIEQKLVSRIPGYVPREVLEEIVLRVKRIARCGQ